MLNIPITNHRNILYTMLVIVMTISQAGATIKLPGIFSDNMVLQRNDNVKIWGNSSAKYVQISTSWDKKKYKVNADHSGNWQATISTPAAGGPYTIGLDDGEKLTLENILIGEVWLCSGQSNMEMPVKGFRNQPTLNSNDILLEADNSQIRLIKYDKIASRIPARDNKSTLWQVSEAQTAKEFSAVAFQFAQTLQRKLNVPVGVIMVAWGGTRIEAWMTQNSLKSFPEIQVKPVSDPSKVGPNDATVLFNAMINPLVGYGIKGILWYQGEANRTNSEKYEQMMGSMVKEWRQLWDRDMAFYYVQIAPFQYADNPLASARLREAQLKASRSIPNSGMAVTMDVGMESFIHPPDKTVVSQRLAFQALSKTYGVKGLAHESPVYKSMSIENDVVNLRFDHAENGLTSFGKILSTFEIAGEDKVFYPASAKLIATGIAVQSDKVKSPVAVHYAFKDWVVGDLYNVEGLPASSFRTDEW